MRTGRPILRAVNRLRELYVARAVKRLESEFVQSLADHQRALERARGMLRQVAIMGWSATALQVRRGLVEVQRAARAALERIGQQMEEPAAIVPDLRCLLAELNQLYDEFGEIQVDLKRNTLSVTTEPITLEEVYLGPFAIELHWPRLLAVPSSHCFEIVALDPHPAATNDSVTHPHVNDGALCAGDAALPIQRALEQCRLADAFCLIRCVLTTYNPDSPHVHLADWQGQRCYGCGCSVDPDDRCWCEACDHDFCQECITSCTCCGCTRCSECLERCPDCDDSCCPSCLARSAHSREPACRSCLEACSASAALVLPNEPDAPSRRCPGCAAEPDEAVSPALTPEDVFISDASTKESHDETAITTAGV
jgi:hypothetical protein